MSTCRIGSLCTGYGGLDLAVMEVLGGELAWCADNDPHVSAILAARFPVPNLGDIANADWASVPAVDVITAGLQGRTPPAVPRAARGGVAPVTGGMTMARIYKRCNCPEPTWRSCPHAWVVRYRTPGGRASNQREQSFTAKREADDFALKVEHDKRAHVFIDPRGGQALFRAEAETWLNRHLGADNSITTYRSVLRAHVLPAIGGKRLAAVRRDDIKSLIAAMRAKGLSASRIRAAHLVISAVFSEAVRDKKLAESPCVAIELPGVVIEKDFIVPTHAQTEALAAGLPPDWASTIWLMQGCGLRIGEALAVNVRCRIADGTILRVNEQVDQQARLRPPKFRKKGDYRDIPLPQYVADAIDKHIADHGTTSDGYLYQGRKYKLVIRRSYQQDFARSAAKAGLPPQFVPHSLRHYFASAALAHGIPRDSPQTVETSVVVIMARAGWPWCAGAWPGQARACPLFLFRGAAGVPGVKGGPQGRRAPARCAAPLRPGWRPRTLSGRSKASGGEAASFARPAQRARRGHAASFPASDRS